MSIDRINPPELARPSGFSHAVVGRGTVIALAGQTALDAGGQVDGRGRGGPVRGGAGQPAHRAAAAGGRPDQLISLTVYLVDLEDYRRHGAEVGAVWRRLAGRDYPAMAAVGVRLLPDPAALVEVQGLAIA